MIRHIFPVLLVSLYLLTFSVFAEEGEVLEPPQETVTVETEADDKNIVVNVTLPVVAAPEVTPSATLEVEELPEINVVNDVYAPYAVSALDDVPAPSTALVETITEVFGEYHPRTQTVTQQLPDGTIVTYQEVVPGLAGLDWPWLAGVGLFALFLYGLLRMIGGLLKL